MDQHKIRESVRESYGAIARANNVKERKEPAATALKPSATILETLQPADCCQTEGSTKTTCGCGPAENKAETETVLNQGSSCCGSGDVSGEQMATIIGYKAGDLKGMPEGANMNLGCGNPVALASLKPGETVVDLGSGGGFDCFLAAREVGKAGQVIGVDMTADMVEKARKNAEKMAADNVEFRLGEIEHLPIGDNTADIIMSNCVINLSPEKDAVYRDALRVLKPGGRLAISDILATAELPESVKNDLALVSACVGGAATIQETEAMLKMAGFENVTVTISDKTRELLDRWDPNKTSEAWDYVVSAYIEGTKPL